jgi:prevent-host-death family protein
MKAVSAYEAKTHLSKLLREVERGRRFVITRHGNAIAVLQPAAAKPVSTVSEAIRELKDFGAAHSLKGAALKAMIEEGRD